MRNKQEWFNEKMAAKSPEIVSEVQLSADKDPGNTLAQAKTNFGAMNPHDSNYFVPPITEVPDYVRADGMAVLPLGPMLPSSWSTKASRSWSGML